MKTYEIRVKVTQEYVLTVDAVDVEAAEMVALHIYESTGLSVQDKTEVIIESEKEIE